MLIPHRWRQVEYTGFSAINVQRFGQPFVNRVANPKDILLFFRRRALAARPDRRPAAAAAGAGAAGAGPHRPLALDGGTVEDLIDTFLATTNMQLLSARNLNKAVRTFVEKDTKDAIAECVIGRGRALTP